MTEDEVREIVREELISEISDVADQDLKQLDDVRSKVSRFRMKLSEQAFDGVFTRGGMQDMEQEFDRIEEALDQIEKTIIEDSR